MGRLRRASDLLSDSTGSGSDVGTIDPVARTMVTVPFVGRTSAGVYVGEDRSVWLYRKLAPYAYTWEKADTRLAMGNRLHQLLVELGRTSRPPMIGEFASLAKNRRVHLVSHTRYVRPRIPVGASPAERAFLDEIFEEDQTAVPETVTAIGVELWPSQPAGRRRAGSSVLGATRSFFARLANTDVPDLDLYDADMREVAGMLARRDATVMTTDEFRMMERWLSGGRTREPFFVEEADRLIVRDRNPRSFDRWERLRALADGADREGDHDRAEELTDEAEEVIMAGGNVIQFLSISEHGIANAEIGVAPDAPWIAEAQQHENAAIAVSLRFELEPGSVTRNRARRTQKQAFKAQDQEDEANARFQSHQGLERIEITDALSGAQAVEDHFATSGEPSIVKLSQIFAWVMRSAEEEMFSDYWTAKYELGAVPLDLRQPEAWLETLPGAHLLAAPQRPFSHDALIATVAHSGIGASARLGDDPDAEANVEKLGVFSGIAHPGGTPLWLNPFAASEQNTPPTMAIIGEPGSGKTFLAQVLCYQFALQGIPVFMVNPKGSDSLRDYAEFCGGESIAISTVEPGAFDPFRYAEGRVVVEIALEHISSALNERGDGLTKNQVIALSQALFEGVQSGAGCVGRCLDFLPSEHAELAEQIRNWAAHNSNFGLGVSFDQRGPLGASRRFTLVEFDQDAALPEVTDPSKLTMMENSAIAGQRLIWRAGIEMMRGAGGGVVAGDEAWTFLSSPQAAAVIASLGRKGRSLGIFLMLMTQRIADVTTADMESYLSRVGVMKLEDDREIRASLDLCRMETTEELVDLIRGAAPKRPERGDPARGIPPTPAKPSRMVFRDLAGRHGIATIEPIPERFRMMFSTNRADKMHRQAERDAVATGLRDEGQYVDG